MRDPRIHASTALAIALLLALPAWAPAQQIQLRAKIVEVSLDAEATFGLADQELDPSAGLSATAKILFAVPFDRLLEYARSAGRGASIDEMEYIVWGDLVRMGTQSEYAILDLKSGTASMVSLDRNMVLEITQADLDNIRKMREDMGEGGMAGIQDQISAAMGRGTPGETEIREIGKAEVDGETTTVVEFDSGSNYGQVHLSPAYNDMVSHRARVQEVMAAMGGSAEEDEIDMIISKYGMMPVLTRELEVSGFNPLPSFDASKMMSVVRGGVTQADVTVPEGLSRQTWADMASGMGMPKN